MEELNKRLRYESQMGWPTKVCELIKKGADVNASDGNHTALMLAANYGRLEVCRLLIQHGADVNARGYRELTALMFAADRGDYDVCALLIKHGADVNARDCSGHTALMNAASRLNARVSALLFLHGADINARDLCGNTAIMLARDAYFTDRSLFVKARQNQTKWES